MCGIFGIASKSGVDPDQLWFGTHRVRHRGPDDWGFVSLAPRNADLHRAHAWRIWEERGVAKDYEVGFGCRRLSILDRSEAGHQPMNLAGTELWIVFNGEIYNYIELRQELSSEREFVTSTDTEVLLAAYDKWDRDCLRHLNGMFAFAIWDQRRMRLFLARDRLGEKPLYYLCRPGQFVFASELKQFFEDASFQREVDHSALADFFLLSLQDHDERTFLRGVKQLRPAHWMEFDLATGNLLGPVRYWTPQIADDLNASRDQALNESLVPLLADSIRLRMRSDVPLGICLSGGLDSNTICTLAASQGVCSFLSAYTMAFPGHPDDEFELAQQTATRAGIRHVAASCCADELWDKLNDFVYMQDGPTGGASTFASWKVFETARADGAVVLLNGQGGDELFAGYDKFFFFWWQILLSTRAWLQLCGSLACYVMRNGFGKWSLVNSRRYLPTQLRGKLPGIWSFALPDFVAGVSTRLDVGCGNSLNQRLWKDLAELSLPCLLHWEDRNSMSVGAEARLPFLDHRLVEAVLRTSAFTKLRRGTTKYSLRQAMSVLPPQVRWQRVKRGFETPARQWFEKDLTGRLDDVLSRRDSPLSAFFDLKSLRTKLHDSSSTLHNALTDKDWFKLAAADAWLQQLKWRSHSRDSELALP